MTEEREGYRRITYEGRAFPTAEQARGRVRHVLFNLDIEVPEEDIIAREVAPGAICPWDAYAWVPEAIWEAQKR
jgi:hypothetical protein